MASSDWMMLNSPTSQQSLSEDPWFTGNFKTGKWMVGGSKVTKVQLYELAKSLDIKGRSYMNKKELVKAIKVARKMMQVK